MKQSLKQSLFVVILLLAITFGYCSTINAESLIRDYSVNSEDSSDAKRSLNLPYDIYSLSLDDISSYPDVISLQKRLNKAYPSTTGLYPHEILVERSSNI